MPSPTTQKKAHCTKDVKPPVQHAVPWAELLKRLWRMDALECPVCHGHMTAMALITEQTAVQRLLEHLGQITVHERARGPPVVAA